MVSKSPKTGAEILAEIARLQEIQDNRAKDATFLGAPRDELDSGVLAERILELRKQLRLLKAV